MLSYHIQTAPRLRLLLLGRVAIDGGTQQLLRRRKAMAVLAYLGRQPGMRHARKSLAEVCLGGNRLELTNMLSCLRQFLRVFPHAGELLAADASHVWLPSACWTSDVSDLERALEGAESANDLLTRIVLRRRALRLDQGLFFPQYDDLYLEDEQTEGNWILDLRAHLFWNLFHHRVALAEDLNRLGHPTDAVFALRDAWGRLDSYWDVPERDTPPGDLRQDWPQARQQQRFQEAAWLHFQLLKDLGCPHALVEEHQRVQRQLRERWGMRTPREWKPLQMWAGGAASCRPHRPDSPLRITYPAPPVGPLLRGRQAQLDTLREGLADGKWQLVSLVGLGGIGKTALALGLAHSLLEAFPEWAPQDRWFVSFAGVSPAPGEVENLTLDQAVERVAWGLGLREPTGATSAGTPVDWLCTALGGGPRLLVLDNLEHVRRAVVPLIEHLLAALPDLRLVTTSRVGLGLSGPGDRHEEPVDPLMVPISDVETDLDGLSRVPSVQLLLDAAERSYTQVQSRARQKGRDPSSFPYRLTQKNAPGIAALCHRLEGHPLSLEIVAARLGKSKVGKVLDALNKCFPRATHRSRDAAALVPEDQSRHRSLTAALDWSFDLLSATSQQLFPMLSVFRGGWSACAVTMVCGADALPPSDRSDSRGADARITECLRELEDARFIFSVPSAFEPRYHFLEPVREYAAHKRSLASGLDPLPDQHEKYYRRVANRAFPLLTSVQAIEWVDRLAEDRENLEAALEHWAEAEPRDDGVWIEALGLLWERRGPLRRGAELVDRLLHDSAGTPAHVRGCWLVTAARLALAQGDNRHALRLAREAEGACQRARETRLLGRAQFALAEALWYTDDPARARSLYGDSLRSAQSANDLVGAAQAQYRLSETSEGIEDRATRRDWVLAALNLAERAGDPWTLLEVLRAAVAIELDLEETQRAEEHFRRANELAQQIRDQRERAKLWQTEGHLAAVHGDYRRRLAAALRALEAWKAMGDHSRTQSMHQTVAICAREIGEYATEQDHIVRAVELAERSRDPHRVRVAHMDRAVYLWAHGQYAEAVEIFQDYLPECRNADIKPEIYQCRLGLVRLFRRTGNFPEARRHAEAGLSLAETMGMHVLLPLRLELARIAMQQAASGTSGFPERLVEAAQHLRDLLETGLEHHRKLALYLEVAAGLAQRCGEPVRCVRLLGFSGQYRRSQETPPVPCEQEELAALEAQARQTLGPEQVAQQLTEGAGMCLREITAGLREWLDGLVAGADPSGPSPAGVQQGYQCRGTRPCSQS